MHLRQNAKMVPAIALNKDWHDLQQKKRSLKAPLVYGVYR
jgi:hypothetical protein